MTEPLRCVCQPGPHAHHEHAKPGKHLALRHDPRCPHWDPASSGLPVIVERVTVPTKRVKRARLDE